MVRYQSLIESLTYLAISTRPDIAHSVCKLVHRNTDPHHEHESAAKHVLRCLAKTIDLKLQYRKTGQGLHAFFDADWANNSLDRKSYTDFGFYLGGPAFPWESKKQGVVAQSSTEEECLINDGRIYLRRLLEEIKFHPPTEPVEIYGVNLSAHQIAANPVLNKRTKHIHIK